jgi:hypothetical protein
MVDSTSISSVSSLRSQPSNDRINSSKAQPAPPQHVEEARNTQGQRPSFDGTRGSELDILV